MAIKARVGVAPNARAPKHVIQSLLDAAENTEARVEDWPGSSADDASMRRMYMEDATDMRDIARLLSHGENATAQRKAYNMDTASRDEIPRDVWIWWELTSGREVLYDRPTQKEIDEVLGKKFTKRSRR